MTIYTTFEVAGRDLLHRGEWEFSTHEEMALMVFAQRRLLHYQRGESMGVLHVLNQETGEVHWVEIISPENHRLSRLEPGDEFPLPWMQPMLRPSADVERLRGVVEQTLEWARGVEERIKELDRKMSRLDLDKSVEITRAIESALDGISRDEDLEDIAGEIADLREGSEDIIKRMEEVL